MGEDLLSLKWNNHKPAFFHLLRILREKGCYTDVTLACGSKFFAVHRLVLMACSDFFSEVFEHTQCQKPVIVLKDIKGHELEALLDYMYLGEVDVQQADLPGLIKAAECLRIKGLAVPDEDPTQTQRPETQSIGERPAKRRRQERDVRETDRGSTGTGSHSGDRGTHASSTDDLVPYTLHRTEVIQGDGEGEESVNKCVVPQTDEEAAHLGAHEAPIVQRTDNLHLQPEQDMSPSRIHEARMHHESRIQHDMRAHDSRSHPEPRIQHDSQTPQEIEPYSQSAPEIKTEHCDINEELENGGLKSEISEIRSEPVNETSGGGGDFSHFLSVEENLAHHMFQQAHQAGPSGLHRPTGRDSSSEVTGEDGSNNRSGVGGSIYPSHLLGEVTPEAASALSNQSGSNGGPGGFFPREAIAQHHCPYCPQSFMFQSILKRHLRTHTGEKPYECPNCDYRSAYKYHVARHMKLHAPQPPRTEGSLILPTHSEGSVTLSCSHNPSIIQVAMVGSAEGGPDVSTGPPPE